MPLRLLSGKVSARTYTLITCNVRDCCMSVLARPRRLWERRTEREVTWPWASAPSGASSSLAKESRSCIENRKPRHTFWLKHIQQSFLCGPLRQRISKAKSLHDTDLKWSRDSGRDIAQSGAVFTVSHRVIFGEILQVTSLHPHQVIYLIISQVTGG